MIFYHSALVDFLTWVLDPPIPVKCSFNTLFPFDKCCNLKNGVFSLPQWDRRFKKLQGFKDTYKGKVFLDCGAFSALRQGFTIDLESYMSFLRDYGEFFEVVAALDVIGDHEATWDNYRLMYERGFQTVMPTYHLSEPSDCLDRLIGHTNYLAIGGMVGKNAKDVVSFCDGVLRDEGGLLKYPEIKFHGFGIGSGKALNHYPWHSCDSTTAVFASTRGEILIPKLFHGKITGLDKVLVSSSQKKRAGHYIHLRDSVREYVDYLLGIFGYFMSDFDEDNFSFGDDTQRSHVHANRILFNIQILERFFTESIKKERVNQPKLL